MNATSKARALIAELLPVLRLAAGYVRTVQSDIQVSGHKSQFGSNFFATALSDADLAVQNLVETALLAKFPEILFFGEEYDRSLNTRYFCGIDFAGTDDLLVSLDPIDGTRCYLDQRDDYQIILSVMSPERYEAVVVVCPVTETLYYGEAGGPLYRGTLEQSLGELAPAPPLPAQKSNLITAGFGAMKLVSRLEQHYSVYCSERDYIPTAPITGSCDILSGVTDASIHMDASLIDALALGFLAERQGYLVRRLDGSALPPLAQHRGMRLGPCVVARDHEVLDTIVSCAKSLSGRGAGSSMPLHS